MVHRFLGDSRISRILRKIRNISVHLPIDLDALYDLVLVCLESAVHIVKSYPRNFACGGIVEFGRDVFSQFVVLTMLFPSRNNVPTVLDNHAVHLRDFLGGVLKVRIHRHHNPAFRSLESAV